MSRLDGRQIQIGVPDTGWATNSVYYGLTVSLNLPNALNDIVTSIKNVQPFIQSNIQALTASYNNSTASNTQLSYTPQGEVLVYVNGQKQQLGYSTASSVCYFGTSSAFARSNYSSVMAGDYLFWNPTNAGFSLDSLDFIDFYYDRLVQ